MFAHTLVFEYLGNWISLKTPQKFWTPVELLDPPLEYTIAQLLRIQTDFQFDVKLFVFVMPIHHGKKSTFFVF